jgi:hypothetical protein
MKGSLFIDATPVERWSGHYQSAGRRIVGGKGGEEKVKVRKDS